MMIELGRKKRDSICSICEGSSDVLVRGAMEGTMGRVWVPKLENSSYCLIVTGDFAFLMGLPPKGAGALNLKSQIYESASFAYLCPENERWEDWLEDQFSGQIRLVSRYAMKRDEHHFDMERLKNFKKSIPAGIRLKQMDARLYHMALKEEWSRDLYSGYDDEKHFMEYGMGYVAVKGREIIAGCSAYRVNEGMINIQAETKKEYRGQGLALACCSAFLMECLQKDVTPIWDCKNLQCVGLAEKLGFVFDKEYQVYQLIDMSEWEI